MLKGIGVNELLHSNPSHLEYSSYTGGTCEGKTKSLEVHIFRNDDVIYYAVNIAPSVMCYFISNAFVHDGRMW